MESKLIKTDSNRSKMLVRFYQLEESDALSCSQTFQRELVVLTQYQIASPSHSFTNGYKLT